MYYLCLFSVKSPDFDLFFHGENGSVSSPPDVAVTDMMKLTVCLWLRYASVGGTGTYLSVRYVIVVSFCQFYIANMIFIVE